MFTPVTRKQNRLRLALDGPAGSGKTYTALTFAFALAGPGGRVAVIDTENSTASKYAGPQPDGTVWQWDNLNLQPGQYAPSTYAQAVRAAGAAKYDVLVIDSLSHAWEGSGGALDQVDRANANGEANRYTAWKNVTPQHRQLVDAMLTSPCHVIVTMRSKTEYVLEPNERGKMVPRKIGLKPIQRDGMEYEFDLVCDIDLQHTMTVSKSRCSAVDSQVVSRPTGAWIEPVREWLYSGEVPPTAAEPAPAVAPGPIPVAATPAPAPTTTASAPTFGKYDTTWTPDHQRLHDLLMQMAHGVGHEALRLLNIYGEYTHRTTGRIMSPGQVCKMSHPWVMATLRKVEDAAADQAIAESERAVADQSAKEGRAA